MTDLIAQEKHKLQIDGSENKFLGFLASLCYEIRTPASIIQGYSELLKERLTDHVDKNSAQTIYNNGEQLLSLLSKLGDLASVETGALMTFISTCSPQKIMRKAAIATQTIAAANDVQISSTCEAALPAYVKVDKKRLSQVLQQVFEQAVRLASQGKVFCHVTASPCKEKQTTITFDVQIPQTKGEYLFSDQLSENGFLPSASDSVSMLLARKLVNRLNGQFEYICDDPNEIKIRFSVPTEVAQNQRSLSQTPSINSYPSQITSAAKKDILRNSRVLIVEDNIDNQILLSFLCERAGATVSIVYNGMIALGELLAADVMHDPYDIILMDIDMPVMDGYETTHRIRKTLDIPIIAITAHTLQGDREKCLEAGCNDYLSKPIDRKLLIETMSRLINEKSANYTSQEVVT